MISVVTPFYNEAQILEKSVAQLLKSLEQLDDDWEMIIVNDGSTDGSGDIAVGIAARHPDRMRLVSYPVNQGRGYALKQGIDTSRGEIIITTEIDSSWGPAIVFQLADFLKANSKIDIVVASPHLPGGGYKNVPLKRVFLSSLGNKLIRLLFHSKIRMFTGMTRGYRASVIKSLPVYEKGKEFHLEVLHKAIALGYTIDEIPCVLEWKDHELVCDGDRAPKRQSSSKVPRLIKTHLFFAFTANPIKLLWGLGLAFMVTGFVCFSWAVVRLIIGQVAIFLALTAGSCVTIGLMFFLLGVLSSQLSIIQKDFWRLQSVILKMRDESQKAVPCGQPEMDGATRKVAVRGFKDSL
ncbi:MAG: glycosyltransferase family 2 protein [Desulfobaccales bacterium]